MKTAKYQIADHSVLLVRRARLQLQPHRFFFRCTSTKSALFYAWILGRIYIITQKPMKIWNLYLPVLLGTLFSVSSALYDKPEEGKPGDQMIQNYLAQEARKLETDLLGDIKSAQDWERERPRLKQEYFEMLGLWPLPEKTDLKATITRTLDRGDYQVDMLHYQSKPGLYVTANLYRPAKIETSAKLPAIFYVCGH